MRAICARISCSRLAEHTSIRMCDNSTFFYYNFFSFRMCCCRCCKQNRRPPPAILSDSTIYSSRMVYTPLFATQCTIISPTCFSEKLRLLNGHCHSKWNYNAKGDALQKPHNADNKIYPQTVLTIVGTFFFFLFIFRCRQSHTWVGVDDYLNMIAVSHADIMLSHGFCM